MMPFIEGCVVCGRPASKGGMFGGPAALCFECEGASKKFDVRRFVELYAAGAPDRACARILRASVTAIAKYRRGLGWPVVAGAQGWWDRQRGAGDRGPLRWEDENAEAVKGIMGA